MEDPNREMHNLISADQPQLEQWCRTVSDRMLASAFGRDAEQIRAYANTPERDLKRGDSLIVLLPGVTGSALEDVAPPRPELLWLNPVTMLRGRLNRMELGPDGLSDAVQGVQCRAVRPLWLAYAKMALRLSRDYAVAAFAYDWRKPLEQAALELAEFIEVQTSAGKFDQVTLAAHSMGGLVSLYYLSLPQTQAQAHKRVRRLVTLGTPFRGALDMVLSFLDPHRHPAKLFNDINAANDLHKALLGFPGLYQLLPAPTDLYPGWRPIPEVDIYAPRSWEAPRIAINAHHLAAARAHHSFMAAADPQVPITNIIGTNYATTVTLGGMSLSLGQAMQDFKLGDGTVPLESARFRGAQAYFVHEIHVELVLENSVIEGIMALVEGGQPSGLASRLEDVRIGDQPFRDPDARLLEASGADIARKIEHDEHLQHQEVKALFHVL